MRNPGFGSPYCKGCGKLMTEEGGIDSVSCCCSAQTYDDGTFNAGYCQVCCPTHSRRAKQKRSRAGETSYEINGGVLRDVLDALDGMPCTFNMCPGADVPFEDMATCNRCCAIQDLRRVRQYPL